MAVLPDTITAEEPPGARPIRPGLAAMAAVNAAAAWAGGVGLIVGAIDFGEPTNDRLPFANLVLAGAALVAIVAIPLTVLAWSAWTGGSRTDDLALVVGSLLIGWIVVQVVVLRAFSAFQPTYLAIGVFFVAASHRAHLDARRRGPLVVAVGAIVTAVGVGLLPHLAKHGPLVASVLSVVMVLVGLGLAARGTADALRRRPRGGQVVGGAATVVAVAVAVWLIAPAVAATNVPPTRLGSTPARLDLAYESVTLSTSDEAELAAWYLPGTNRAGVVMVHGAGSTRSDVLDQAAALVRGGYGVLLVDARGHGDSRGAAMDFGWYGDLDITAAVDFLASRDDIDPGRIGVVGFSMGGEEAIGAAAADPRIQAVVAEGATGRQARDKAWYSQTYGWRGWLQEQFEKVQFGVTDFLTPASPPTPLRAAVAHASGTHFLLITAGDVADERHAAAYIRAAAPDRVTTWNVDGADHIAGYRTDPSRWRRRVTAFLDERLR